MLTRRAMVALLGALPAACASPNPTLYTLAVVPGAEHVGAPHVIELRAIAVAHYLERSQIVRSSEDFRLDVLGNEWWGEPLDAMIGRVLSDEFFENRDWPVASSVAILVLLVLVIPIMLFQHFQRRELEAKK